MKARTAIVYFSVYILITILQVHATTLAKLSLDGLAAAADSVARVRCVSTESRWENGSIWTATAFEVLETMKGNLPTHIIVRLPGGHVGHLTSTVSGAPKFNSGEKAILFLERSRAGGFTIAGWVEGTFRISRDPRTGAATVTQDSSAFGVFDAATRTFRTEGIRLVPLSEFRARLDAAITRSKALGSSPAGGQAVGTRQDKEKTR
jgi:hypothetical protein